VSLVNVDDLPNRLILTHDPLPQVTIQRFRFASGLRRI
jgi:hypothetical protein